MWKVVLTFEDGKRVILWLEQRQNYDNFLSHAMVRLGNVVNHMEITWVENSSDFPPQK